jgi:hypothetical protein
MPKESLGERSFHCNYGQYIDTPLPVGTSSPHRDAGHLSFPLIGVTDPLPQARHFTHNDLAIIFPNETGDPLN